MRDVILQEVEVTMALRDCESASTSATKTRGRVGVAKSGEGKRTGAERERERLHGGSASSLELEWEDEEPQAKKSHAANPSGTRNRKSSSKVCLTLQRYGFPMKHDLQTIFETTLHFLLSLDN